jgi:glucokinase
MSHTVAVDIGGTHIRVALFEPDSVTPIAHQRTRSLANEPGVYDRLERAIESVWPQGNVRAIGIASPGPLDPHTGTILATPNIPEWQFSIDCRVVPTFNVPFTSVTTPTWQDSPVALQERSENIVT